MFKRIITYQCPLCGYISDKDYDVCPACNNGQTETIYTATFTMPDSAEHLIDANKMMGDHIADDSKKVVDTPQEPQELDSVALQELQTYLPQGSGTDGICYFIGPQMLAMFKAGANWQKEQFHDACYQCEKAYDNVFYRGEQHAIKMMKEEATEATVYEDAGGYPFIPAIEMYDYDKDEPTAKNGDKVKLYIFKNDIDC